jgi:hypothetical protein
MKESKGADEGGDAAGHETAGTLTRFPDDQGDPYPDQGQRHDKSPYPEEEDAAGLDSLANWSGLTQKCQDHEDGDDNQGKAPNIIGLSTQRVSHVVT